MNLADRLRSVVRPAGGDGPESPSLQSVRIGHQSGHTDRCRGGPSGPPLKDIAETLGGEWREARGQRYLVIDRTFPAGHVLGRVAVADCLPAADGLWPRLELLRCGASSGELRDRLLFVDLETTGLAGGAGTYAFLVGCGWFEGTAFRVRQFLLTSFMAERGLLQNVADTMGAAGALVTYNGKTFDLPLIDTRFLFHRMEAPFSSLPHLDMLHPARRLWGSAETGGSASQDPPDVPHPTAAAALGTPRRPGSAEPAAASADPANMRRSSCRQTVVEQAVLGHVREGDVPGFEIPSRYFHYVRTGDARPLEGVLEHNRLDLLGLAMLTAQGASLLEEGAAGARTAREALGLGRLYERGGLIAEARACFARAAGAGAGADLPAGPALASRVAGRPDAGEGGKVRPYNDLDAATMAEALRAYAMISRRVREYEEAAGAWRRILALRACPAHIAQEATEALAVHHEHRLRDFRAARQFAMQALQFDISTTRIEAVYHRVARIDRKLGTPAPQLPPLF